MFRAVGNEILFARDAHRGDRWGRYDYSQHLSLVADEVKHLVNDDTLIATYLAAAYLHDVITIHPELEEQVRGKFYSLYPSLKTVTRGEYETYDEYIRRIISSGDRIAIVVKLADIRVNMRHNTPDYLREVYVEVHPILRDAAVACGVEVTDNDNV